ncbi:MAG: pre-peptidase C-terminal domain-containing protein [Phycisphaerales bacterium]|nr:pre-peptidase C-terminal domain-containing protein [Phycisphaerales bacterium]
MSIKTTLGAAAILATAGAASADFAGQTIFGPITNGSMVSGDTTGATDDNDGFTSGDHIFFIWNAPDDVWQLDWPGGDMTVTLDFDDFFADLELFVYTPASYNDSGDYSITSSSPEVVNIAGAAAGTYYIVIDGPSASDVGAYNLSVIPAPGAAALLAFGGLPAARRRRN